MNSYDKILKMFKLQNDLNVYTNGNGWIEGFTSKGLEINWLRCLRFEMVEAIDQSVFWKHWKNIENGKQYDILGDNGLHNLKIEFVDGWHFLMSEIIKQSWEEEISKEILKLNENEYVLSGKELVLSIEKIERLVFKYEDDNSFQNMKELVDMYFKVAFSIMNLQDMYEMYVLKNVLNIFRQNNGYKNGTYIKNWGKDKIEDNEFLNEYIKYNVEEEISFEKIYEYLDTKYKELN